MWSDLIPRFAWLLLAELACVNGAAISRLTFARGGCAAALLPTRSAAAATYDDYAAHYDALDGGSAAKLLGLDSARRRALSSARGRVLEVGAGTGLNLPFYDLDVDARVSSLALLDASDGMLAVARAKARAFSRRDAVRFVVGDAERLDGLGDHAYDTLVDTFSLCVYDDPLAALRAMRRVVRPAREGGRVILLENSRPKNALLGAYVDATADAVAAHGGKGCRYNQDVAALATEAGFTIEDETSLLGGVFRSFVLSHDDATPQASTSPSQDRR